MEYVNIPLLYDAMYEAMRQCSGVGGGVNGHSQHYIGMFACLVGLTGTDFSRNLPLIGVETMWDLLANRDVWNGLCMSFDTQQGRLDIEKTRDFFISRLYRNKFSKHTGGTDLTGVMRDLNQKLGDRNKKLLPSASRVDTTIRNINWILLYWQCVEPLEVDNQWDYMLACPDPICPEFGFAYRTTTTNKRVVVWGDS
jgi:hypothetical protein